MQGYLLFCLLSIFSLYSEIKADTKAVGLIIAAQGNFHLFDQKQQEKKGNLGSNLFVGDIIKTERGASIKVLFTDKSTFSLAGQGVFEIKQYQFNGHKESRSEIVVHQGSFDFMAGKISEIAPENFKIRTAVATIGIRGSGGEGIVSKEGLKISTKKNHILDVKTTNQDHFIIDDPSELLTINSLGEASWSYLESSLFDDALIQNALAISMKKTNPQAPQEPVYPIYRKITYHLHRREKIQLIKLKIKKINQRTSAVKEFEKQFPTLKIDNQIRSMDEIGREKAELSPFTKEKHQKTQVVQTDSFLQTLPPLKMEESEDKIDKEKSSSFSMMKKMAQESLISQKTKALSKVIFKGNRNS